VVRRIYIVGGLPTSTGPAALLSRLRQQTGNEVEWEWVHTFPYAYNLPKDQYGSFAKMLHPFRAGDPPEDLPTVLALKCLHRQVSKKLRSVIPDPILVPTGIVDEDQLFDWIFAEDSGLFPPREWFGNACEAAFMAIAEKLLGNRSVNGDHSGHNWTKEHDLLNQAPVMRSDCPEIRDEAVALLTSLQGNLLLTKGSGHGKTPKGWSVNTQFLPGLKKAIVGCSFDPLEEHPELKETVQRIRADGNRCYRIDGQIISETVICFCRGRD